MQGFMPTAIIATEKYTLVPGADPAFLKGGFKSIKKGFVFNILPDFFHTFPNEIEIICFQRGVQANHLNPL